jgi:hypothetical protein
MLMGRYPAGESVGLEVAQQIELTASQWAGHARRPGRTVRSSADGTFVAFPVVVVDEVADGATVHRTE